MKINSVAFNENADTLGTVPTRGCSMFLRFSIACAALLIVSAGQAQSAIIYNESVDGDLPSSSPNLGSLAAGTNTVLGTVSMSPSDLDTFSFVIPKGSTVTGITVSVTERNSVFFNLRFDLYSGAGFGGTNLENVLTFGTSDTKNFTVTPLSDGTYTMGVGFQIGGSNVIMDYSVGISVTSVPEPSSFALFGIASVTGLVAARRRRPKAS